MNGGSGSAAADQSIASLLASAIAYGSSGFSRR